MTPEPDLGRRPHSNTLPCADCGHVWFEGERRHEYVDAEGEVTTEDGADAVCVLCHQKRRRPRPHDEGVKYW
ncbi:MAG: hypothetical protein WKF42_00380 [Solirubrobacteraceae bacterium]